MGYGVNGHVGFSAQQSFKTAVTSFDYVPFISETITTNVEELIQENMLARFDEPESKPGILWVGGDIAFEPHPTLLGHFLRGVTGQASSTAVDSVLSWQFVPKQTDFSDNCALPPFTMEIFLDVGSSYQFTDVLIHTLTIDINAGEITKCNASVIGRVSSLMAKNTPTFGAGDPWTWDQASVSFGGSANELFETLSISIENPIEGVPTLDNTQLYNRFKRNGFRMSKMAGTMDFSDQTEFNLFRLNSHQAVVITLTDATAISSGRNNVVKLDMPKFRYVSYPIEASGPNRISVSFEGKAMYDTTSNYAILPTLTNTRISYSN